ncbi:hypothetical protein [Thermococcus sp. 21S9]|uniref:hypothetical protein n=1 Tax=Thermococcus sp. 21S9 TaxID=1638223 RepID=UPI00143A5B5A|nr:hypothetical protein [Thermococcus sp. 21S9]NJE54587.1 hypothetical protein [Thermococcus sp. 21S9]
MIGVLLSIIASYWAGTYVGALSIVPWLLSLKKRDAGLVAFFLYALYLGNSVQVSTVYSYSSLIAVLSFSIAFIVLLDDVLTERLLPGRRELIAVPFILLGAIFPESLIVGGVVVLVSRVRFGRIANAVMGVIIVAFTLLRETLDYAGSSLVQVAVIASIGIFTFSLLLFWKNFKKVLLFDGQ